MAQEKPATQQQQRQPPLPSTTRITAVAYMLGVLMVVGKYLPAITAFFAALNLVLATYDFYSGQTGWMILHLLFGIGGVIFLVQLYQRRNIHSYDYHYRDGEIHYPAMKRGEERQN
jgi:hypothetical protein